MKRVNSPAQIAQLERLHLSNKGSNRIITDEWRKNLSESHKGQRVSIATEFKKGHVSPWKGKHLPEYARKKMALAKIGRKLSTEHKNKIGAAHKKEKHWNWKGGVSTEVSAIRNSVKYKMWRQACMSRDRFICQDCKCVGGKLEAHHLKPFHVLLSEAIAYLPLFSKYDAAMGYSPMWDLNNGKTLCINCHSKINKRRSK